jgi:Na+/phosphate symporter
MDWPGATEMAERLKKTIDPKLLSDQDDPALQAANQQIEAMGKEMEQMHQMLQNVSKSMEARDIAIKEFDSQVKAYQAETQRISAVQAGMSPEQISDIVMGTIAAAMDTGDLIGQMPTRESMAGEMPQESMGQAPQQGMQNEGM